MQKAELTKRIAETGAMAIVRVETIERGIEIANGCLEGGVSCLEISYTLPNAGEVIQALRETFQDRLIIGAGTVLDSETARHAILHNAQFIIAPNFSQGGCRYVQPVSDSLCAGLYDINGSTSGSGSRGSLYQGVSDFRFLWSQTGIRIQDADSLYADSCERGN